MIMEEVVAAIRNILQGDALEETLFLLLNEVRFVESQRRVNTWTRMIVEGFERLHKPGARVLDSLALSVESYTEHLRNLKPQDVATIVSNVKNQLLERNYSLLDDQSPESFLSYAKPEHTPQIEEIVEDFKITVNTRTDIGLKEAFAQAIQKAIVDKEPFNGDIEKFSIALSSRSDLHGIINHAEVTLKIMGYDLEDSEME